MPQDAPFLDAQGAYDKTYKRFGDDYVTQIAAALKGSWNRDKMSGFGYPKEPSDKQFKDWAKELINTRQITYSDPNDPDKKGAAIPLQVIQGELPENVKNDLRRKFGTDDLNYIILDKDQFPTAGQQLAQASWNQRGSEFLGGATLLNFIMGALDWLIDKLQGGDMGFQEAIARRTTQSMAGDADKMLARNAPSIHPGMRRYLISQYKEGADQEAGLAPRTAAPKLSDIAIGANVPKPETGARKTETPAPGVDGPAAGTQGPAPSTGSDTAAQAPAMNLQGTPEQRVTQVITGISDQVIADMANTQKDNPEAMKKVQAAADALKPDMIAIGTEVLMGNQQMLERGDSQGLAKAYAKALMNDPRTKDRLKAPFKEKYPDLDEKTVGELVEGSISGLIKGRLENQRNRDNLLAAMNGQNAPAAPAAEATAGTTPEATAPTTPAPSQPAESMAETVMGGMKILIAGKTTAQTREFVVEQARTGYNKTWFGIGYGPIKKELKLLNRFEGATPNDPADQKALKDAKDKVYQYAIDNGYAPNANANGQQSIISKAVGEAVANTVSDPRNKGLSKGALAGRVETAIMQELQKKRGEIDARGTSVAEISKNAGFDMFAAIAKKVGDEVRNPDGKTYGQLVDAQKQVSGMQLAGLDRSGLTSQIRHTSQGTMIPGEQGVQSLPGVVPGAQNQLG